MKIGRILSGMKEKFYFLRMTFPSSVIESKHVNDQVGLVERLVEGLVESQKEIVKLIIDNPNVSK